MSQLYKQFSTGNGRFVRFQIKNKKFYIIRGQGGEVKTKDVFPLEAAKAIVYDILDLTQELRTNASNTARVDQALNSNQQMRPQQAEKHIRDVIRNTQKNDKLGKIEFVLDKNPDLGDGRKRDARYEKVLEQVVDAIHDNFGYKYFVSAQFSKMYDKKWSEGNPRWWLKHLHHKSYVVREEVDDLDDFHGNTKFKYRLGASARNKLEKGRLASDSNPTWKYKKELLAERHKPPTA